MVKVVVVSHGDYAAGMLNASKMLIGEYDNVYTADLQQGCSSEDFLECIKKYTADIDSENQVIFLCDIFAGTPFNVCSVVSSGNENAKVVYGTNLPMLLEALTQKDSMKVGELAEYLMNSVKETIGIGQMQ